MSISFKLFSCLLILSEVVDNTWAVQPAYDYSQKPISELLLLLEHSDAQKRVCASIYLGKNYANPNQVSINFIPLSRERSSMLLPSEQIENALRQHLEGDPDVGVRLSALAALEDMRYRINTTPVINKALSNEVVIIRIRAVDSLIRMSKTYHDPLPDNVVATLVECLTTDNDPDELWQAIYTLGHLGSRAKAAIPVLAKLTTHKSAKVRMYAVETLKKINLSIQTEHSGGPCKP